MNNSVNNFIFFLIFLSQTNAFSENKNWLNKFIDTSKKEIFVTNKSEYLTDPELYVRCYKMFLRYPINVENKVLQKVVAGEISGADACVNLIELSKLDKNGILKNSELTSFEVKRLLSTVNLLHSSWFDAYSFGFSGENFGTGEFVDFQQMGYVLTRSFFSNAKISSVLSGNTVVKPVRDSININKYLLSRNAHTGEHLPWDHIGQYYGDDSKIEPVISQAPRGPLQGVDIDTTPVYLKKYYIQYEKFTENTTSTLTRNFGGGLLGNSTYLLLNMGDKIGVIQETEARIPRRWVKAVFKDILCRNLPVLEPEDATKYLIKNSNFSFSKSQTCIQCHATMDQFTGAIRDVQGGVNTFAGLDFDQNKILQKNSKIGFSFLRSVHESKLLKPSENTYAFAKKDGRVRMRDFQGNELDEYYANLEELGKILSNTDDFYMCQAKRYFKFLTGLDVETDPLVLNTLKTSSQERKILNQVYILAMDLKKNQNVKKIIAKILRSPFYSHKNFSPIQTARSSNETSVE